MDLMAGNVVAVKHYSMISVFTSIVANVQDQFIEIELPKECMGAEFCRATFGRGL